MTSKRSVKGFQFNQSKFIWMVSFYYFADKRGDGIMFKFLKECVYSVWVQFWSETVHKTREVSGRDSSLGSCWEGRLSWSHADKVVTYSLVSTASHTRPTFADFPLRCWCMRMMRYKVQLHVVLALHMCPIWYLFIHLSRVVKRRVEHITQG